MNNFDFKTGDMCYIPADVPLYIVTQEAEDSWTSLIDKTDIPKHGIYLNPRKVSDRNVGFHFVLLGGKKVCIAEKYIYSPKRGD